MEEDELFLNHESAKKTLYRTGEGEKRLRGVVINSIPIKAAAATCLAPSTRHMFFFVYKLIMKFSLLMGNAHQLKVSADSLL